jgi:N-acetylglucosaminyl-diphospho-decaprenol L-rhamnosyltransferase
MLVVSADLAIVVVTYNSAHVVSGLLDSLPGALAGLVADVVVVDNGSADGTVAVLAARSDCRVVTSTNVGYAGGINRGVAAAEPCDAILVLNPDVRLGKASIPALLRALSRDGIGIAVPQVRTEHGALDLSLRREPSVLRAIGLNSTKLPIFSEYLGRPAEYREARVVDWALGAVLLMSRSCYQAVGGWDESYFLYSEETDFCLGARDAGFVTYYVPDAIAVHIGAQSGQSSTTHVMQIVNRVRLYRRRHNVVAAWAYYLATLASEVSWVIRGHRQSWTAICALIRPSRRPAMLRTADRMMPT